jgi:hypothetical protein
MLRQLVGKRPPTVGIHLSVDALEKEKLFGAHRRTNDTPRAIISSSNLYTKSDESGLM